MEIKIKIPLKEKKKKTLSSKINYFDKINIQRKKRDISIFNYNINFLSFFSNNVTLPQIFT